MTEALIPVANKAVPVIIKEIAPALKDLSGQICDVIKINGCKNQRALTDAINTAVPAFAPYCEKFTTQLFEFVTIAEQSSSKNWELIANVVVNNEDTSVAEKVKLIQNIENNRIDNNVKITNTVVNGVSKVCLVVGCVIIAIGAEMVINNKIATDGKWSVQIGKWLRRHFK